MRAAHEPAPADLIVLPPTTLIICSRNRPDLLLDSVRSILEGDEVPTEMIIIDQSDTLHETLSVLKTDRACELRYCWSQTIGLSRANNLGIAQAHYDLLVFTHDDVLVAADWFGTLARALIAAGPRSIITGQVRANDERPGGFQLTIKTDEQPAIYAGRLKEDVLFPLNMAMYRSALREVGVFDVRLGPGTPFPGAEDNDLGYRLLEAGYHIIYVPQAVVYHRAWRPAEGFRRLRWNYGLARGAFYAKYLSLRDRFILRRMLSDIRLHLVLFVRRLRSDRRLAWGDAALTAGIIYGAIKWLLLLLKHRIQASDE